MLVAACWTVEGHRAMMTPWCSEGDEPTSANLNIFGQKGSAVGWHSDDEPRCGRQRSFFMSVGSDSTFKWKTQSCSASGPSSCWLQRGDLLIVDGQVQDDFVHCTNFHWIERHAASCALPNTDVLCCLPTCAKGSFGRGTIDGGLWLLGGLVCSWCLF